MISLYKKVSIKCSRLTTRTYSTSFSLGIRFLAKNLRDPICAIYGFVRFADEIVDTFHGFNQSELLSKFRADTYEAIEMGISLNPILQSFQKTVNSYGIEIDCIETFLKSMRMDLEQQNFSQSEYETYIMGSAEVVGLMCLRVFVDGDTKAYRQLKPFAMKLGSAFQKINFLRDLNADYESLGRSYFPGVDLAVFDSKTKQEIEADIEKDFRIGYAGIKQLPGNARFGVFIAYVYYYQLFEKIKRQTSHSVLKSRIRISNRRKFALLLSSYLRHSFNLI